MSGQGQSKKAVIAALLANAVIAAGKFVVFLLTGAASLLAESIHSVADTGNQGLLLYGGKAAARPADDEHPFGYGKRRYFWSFVVALVLFSMGGLFAIYEGVEKLRNPHELESIELAIGLLVFALVAETVSFRTALVEARKASLGRSLWQFIRHSKAPELPVVLLEDLGAQAGLFFALLGVVMAKVTDEPRWDAVGSLAIGMLLVVIALFLAAEMSSLLLGEAASTDDTARIRDAITGHDDVQRLIHLRTEHIGPEEIVVATKLEFSRELTMERLADVIDEVEARIRDAVPAARVIFVEPGIYRAPVPQAGA